jgi:tRNA(fMet)-specific endonuclease VapC
MNYMLDTNTCIYLMTSRYPDYQANIVAHLDALMEEDEVFLSSVVVAELSYGAHKGKWRKANTAILEKFLLDFTIAAVDEECALKAGAIRAELESHGTPIGPYDTLIAAHAVIRADMLVTHNTNEFSRVMGLKFTDWAIKPDE